MLLGLIPWVENSDKLWAHSVVKVEAAGDIADSGRR